ncbi:MAG: hypothetical protein WDM96_13330 [Lacunisphaera sp.]
MKSFQIAQLAYDVTVRFYDRYISPRSRTYDQMVQAARSGVQNIAEGRASIASMKSIPALTRKSPPTPRTSSSAWRARCSTARSRRWRRASSAKAVSRSDCTAYVRDGEWSEAVVATEP